MNNNSINAYKNSFYVFEFQARIWRWNSGKDRHKTAIRFYSRKTRRRRRKYWLMVNNLIYSKALPEAHVYSRLFVIVTYRHDRSTRWTNRYHCSWLRGQHCPEHWRTFVAFDVFIFNILSEFSVKTNTHTQRYVLHYFLSAFDDNDFHV